MKVALIDMDGVIADTHHREWIIDNIKSVPKEKKQARWDMFHRFMNLDEPLNGIIIDVNSIPIDTLIIILTGRPEKYKEETLKQLKQWGVRYDHLIMRKNGDKQSAVHMKKRAAMNMMEIGLDIVKAYDDRADICEMYCELEIPTVEIKYNG